MRSCKTKVWRRSAPAPLLGARFFGGAIYRGKPLNFNEAWTNDRATEKSNDRSINLSIEFELFVYFR